MTRQNSPPPTTHPTQRWKELVSAALLGIDRAQGVANSAGDVPWLPSGSTEEGPIDQFLHEVAGLANYELIGRHAVSLTETPPFPKWVPSGRVCRSEAASHLAQILHGGREELLTEWCCAAVDGGWQAPADLLPALLDQAYRTDSLEQRGNFMDTVGSRGHWLAALNPEWQPLLAERDETPAVELWTTGTRQQRLALLRQLRARERHLAQQLVEQGWQAETAADRATILQQFAENLDRSDEEWLEKCLDDRSKQVREVAAQLLSKLTESAFSQRMAERVRGCVRYESGRGILKKKGPQIDVTFPATIDASMKRDTLGEKVLQSMGPNASLLAQMVGFAPLAVWDDRKPADWIAAALASEWSWPLLSGWTSAAEWQKNALWSRALLQYVALAPTDKKHRPTQQGRVESIPSLVAVLPPEDRESLALDFLEGGLDGTSATTFDVLLASYTFPWSETLSSAMLDYVDRRVRDHKVSYDYQLRSLLLKVVSLHFDPTLSSRFANRMDQAFQDHTNKMFDTILEVVETLRFRRDMLRSLSA